MLEERRSVLRARKAMWLVIFAAVQGMIVLLAGVSWLMTSGRHDEASFEERLAVYVLAGMAFAVSVGLAQYRMRPTGDPTVDRALDPAKFQVNSLLTLAVGETGTLIGFAIVGIKSFAHFAILPLANVAVNVFIVLPAGLAYWAWMESRQDT